METAAVEIVQPNSIRERAGAYWELTKPRIAFMLVLTSAAGYYLGSAGHFDFLLFVNTLVGISLLAFGVAVLNQFIERDTDALMMRTARRPLPTQRVSPVEALVFGIVLCLAAELHFLIAVNTLTAFLGLTVIVGYVLLYTPLKTRTTASTAIGAIPGAMPPLMGWTAAANEITIGAWALFAMLFLWQFPHFLAIAWMYREEYRKAGIRMLPSMEENGTITARQIVLFTIMLIPVSLAPFFLGMSGVVFAVVAAGLGLWFLFESVRTARLRTTAAARRLLLASVLYLPVLLASMILNH